MSTKPGKRSGRRGSSGIFVVNNITHSNAGIDRVWTRHLLELKANVGIFSLIALCKNKTSFEKEKGSIVLSGNHMYVMCWSSSNITSPRIMDNMCNYV